MLASTPLAVTELASTSHDVSGVNDPSLFALDATLTPRQTGSISGPVLVIIYED